MSEQPVYKIFHEIYSAASHDTNCPIPYIANPTYSRF